MQKTILAIISIAVLTMGSVHAQDLQNILDKHFESIGQQKILKVQTQVTTGKTIQMGMEMPIRIITKRPNKAYMEVEIQGSKMTMAFDGENGWAIQPWTGSTEPIDLAGEELRPLKEIYNLDGSLWNYKEKGHKLELLGTEDLDGTEVYVLKLTRNDENIFHYYLDSEKYILLKMSYKMFVNGQESEIDAYMSNFQDIEGFIMPFTIEQRFDGQTGITIKYEEVRFNEKIDDAIFEKPAPAGKQ